MVSDFITVISSVVIIGFISLVTYKAFKEHKTVMETSPYKESKSNGRYSVRDNKGRFVRK